MERLGKELLRVFLAFNSEWKMRPAEWPYLLLLVHIALNMATSPQRGIVSPLTEITGLPPTPPVSTFIRSYTTATVTVSELQRDRSPKLS